MGHQVWVTTTVAGPLDRLWHLRFYEGPVGFRFPMLASGTAELREASDDERERFAIDVRVSNRRFGPLVGYRGWFTCTYPEVVGEDVPPSVKPLREERRR